MGNRDNQAFSEVKYTKITAAVERLFQSGLDGEFFERILKDDDYRSDVVTFAKCGRGLRPSIPRSQAKKTLGDRFFDLKAWDDELALPLSPAERMSAEWFPWDDGILWGPCPFEPDKQVRETHFAFFARNKIKTVGSDWIPLSIKEWSILTYDRRRKNRLEICLESGTMSQYTADWNQKECCTPGWHLVYMGTVQPQDVSIHDMFGIEHIDPWEAQDKVLKPLGYRVPEPIVLVTAHVLFRIQNGYSALDNQTVRSRTGQNMPPQLDAMHTHAERREIAISYADEVNERGKRDFILSLQQADQYENRHGIGAMRLLPEPLDPATIRGPEI